MDDRENALFEQFYETTLTVAQKYVRDQGVPIADREDVVQDAYLQVSQMPRLEVGGLKLKLHRAVADYFRRSHRTSLVRDEDVPADVDDTQAIQVDMERFVSGCTPDQQTLFRLYYREHKSMSEIGTDLGVSRMSVSRRLDDLSAEIVRFFDGSEHA